MEAISMVMILISVLAVPVGLVIWLVRAIKKKGKNWIGWGTAVAGIVLFVVGMALWPLESGEMAQQAPAGIAEAGNASPVPTEAAAIDRVVHHSLIIEFGRDIKSYRAEEAARRIGIHFDEPSAAQDTAV